ncbi:MAG: 30S ribosomal protein S16 [Fimbriimonadaceae bacterium]|nr:30S ribosomal protein S16 [Fimbriimonadaceae bacterium]
MGNKGRPFYRIVVARSTAARNGSFVEVLGTYDPLTRPSTVKLDNERALHWLLTGAQPTETMAHILQREGVLEKFFEQRPAAKQKYKGLNKVTAAMSRKSVVEAPAPAEKTEAPAAAPMVGEVAATVAETAPVVEAPAAEEAVSEEVVAEIAESPVAEAAPEPVAEEAAEEKPADA